MEKKSQQKQPIRSPLHMSRTLLLCQVAILVLLSWFFSQNFSAYNAYELQFRTNALSEELTKLQQRLNQLDQAVKQLRAVPAGGDLYVPEQNNVRQESSLKQLAGRVEALEAREQEMQQLVLALKKKQAQQLQRQKQAQPEPLRVRNWLDTLPAEKKAEVQAVYREQADLMQKAIPVTPDAPPPNPDEMLRLIQESREALNLRLKNILNADEYQAFLDSLDEADIPLGLPLLEE